MNNPTIILIGWAIFTVIALIIGFVLLYQNYKGKDNGKD